VLLHGKALGDHELCLEVCEVGIIEAELAFVERHRRPGPGGGAAPRPDRRSGKSPRIPLSMRLPLPHSRSQLLLPVESCEVLP